MKVVSSGRKTSQVLAGITKQLRHCRTVIACSSEAEDMAAVYDVAGWTKLCDSMPYEKRKLKLVKSGKIVEKFVTVNECRRKVFRYF